MRQVQLAAKRGAVVGGQGAAVIVITQGQMDVLGQAHRRAGNLRIANHFERRFPGLLEGRSVEEKIALAEKYRQQAATHGFREDREIAYYMDLCVMYGTEFARTRHFQPIMSNPALSPGDKILHVKALLAHHGVPL